MLLALLKPRQAAAMSSRAQLNQALDAFGLELRVFSSRLGENVNALKKTVDMKPHAGGGPRATAVCTA